MEEKREKGDLHFYHNKEAFLENESPSVKWMRSIQTKRPSVLGSIFSNKATAFLFITILVISGIYSAFMFLGPQGLQVEGCEFSATAFEFDSTIYVALKKVQSNPLVIPLDITVDISSEGVNLGSFNHILLNDKEQIFRYTLPYSSKTKGLVFIITIKNKSYKLNIQLTKEK